MYRIAYNIIKYEILRLLTSIDTKRIIIIYIYTWKQNNKYLNKS